MEEKINTIEDYPLQPATPSEIPKPVIWPLGWALGFLFLVWGIVTSFFISAIGLILVIINLAGWIEELLTE